MTLFIFHYFLLIVFSQLLFTHMADDIRTYFEKGLQQLIIAHFKEFQERKMELR